MTISALSPSDPTAAAAQVAGTSSADMEQRFLTLLVTQLNNQDPLNPMDNAQITSQMAEMSTVSGVEKMNTTLQSILAQASSGQMLQAAGMVGRTVTSQGSGLVAGNGPVPFEVNLSASAQSAKAVITDAAGSVVRTIDLGALPPGSTPQIWDGNDDAGKTAPAGLYQLQVVAANGAAPVTATTNVSSQVASVAQSAAGGVTLSLVDGRSIALSDVLAVR